MVLRVPDFQDSSEGVSQVGEGADMRSYQCPKGETQGCSNCWAPPTEVILDVKQAEGGAELWPTVLSADFFREFEVSLSSDAPIRSEQAKGSAPCEIAVEFDIALEITLRASDISVIPVQICEYD